MAMFLSVYGYTLYTIGQLKPVGVPWGGMNASLVNPYLDLCQANQWDLQHANSPTLAALFLLNAQYMLFFCLFAHIYV